MIFSLGCLLPMSVKLQRSLYARLWIAFRFDSRFSVGMIANCDILCVRCAFFLVSESVEYRTLFRRPALFQKMISFEDFSGRLVKSVQLTVTNSRICSKMTSNQRSSSILCLIISTQFEIMFFFYGFDFKRSVVK